MTSTETHTGAYPETDPGPRSGPQPGTPGGQPRPVAPIGDYEPAPRAISHLRATPVLRRRHRPGPTPPAGRDQVRAPRPDAAARFADAALRGVLEVIDRRRPAAQLRTLLTANLFDSLPGMAATLRTLRRDGAAAALYRVRLQPVNGSSSAAEVFATYRRGPRMHAIAGRIEVTDAGWQVVALHIG